MKFHIISSLSKSLRFAKSTFFLALLLPSILAACKEGEASEKAPQKIEIKAKVSPLEREIEKMLRTKKDDPKKLVKLVKGKPWEELLKACMKIEKSLDLKPSKSRIVWARFVVRGAFYDAQTEEYAKEKAENLKKLEALLLEMAREEGLLPE